MCFTPPTPQNKERSKNSFAFGDLVTVENRGKGRIRFIGNTHFGDGLWYGVELGEKGTGDHDGSIKGMKVFRLFCHFCHGLFVSPCKVARNRWQNETKKFSFLRQYFICKKTGKNVGIFARKDMMKS